MGGLDQRVGHACAAGKQIDTADVIALLREVYAEGIATREEAEELIAFDQSLPEPSPGWTEFFAATISDHVLLRQPPVRIMDRDKTRWLIAALGRGRHAATEGGFAAVLRLVGAADDVAPELASFAVRQVRSAVVAARRPASSVRLFLNRTIDSETAALVRRIVIACAGKPGRPVSREEAEALFDLHDLTARGANDGDFDDLFFKAVAHHLIASAGHSVPARSEALPRHSKFPHGLGRDVPLGPDQSAWLASHIMRDGQPTPAEFVLLHFFTGQGDRADANLRRFMTEAA